MGRAFRFLLFAVAIATAATTGWLAHAQTAAPGPQGLQIVPGSDIGFRIDARLGPPFGTLVIRVNGQWVDAKFSSGAKLLTTN